MAYNDQRLCLSGAHYLADQLGIDREAVRVLDVPEDDPKAPADERVDLLVAVGDVQISLEHTLIESYPNQIGDAAHLRSFVARVDEHLPTLPPGLFVLTMETAAVAGVVGQQEAATAEATAEAVGPLLEPLAGDRDRRQVRLEVQGVPGRVALTYRPGSDSGPLGFGRWVPDELEPKRVERLATAFDKKLPKLAATCRRGFEPCLVLEDQDLSLANPDLILEAGKEALADRDEQQPHWIVVAETLPTAPLWWTLFDSGGWVGIDNSQMTRVPLPDWPP